MTRTLFIGLDNILVNIEAMNLLKNTFDCIRVASARPVAVKELVALGDTVDATIVGIQECIDETVVRHLTRMRVLGSISTGTDHLHLDALHDRGITVVTAKGANALAVAEHTLAMILALRKRLFAGYEASRTGKDRTALPDLPQELSQQTVGLLGAGATARALIQLLLPFACKIRIWTPHPDYHQDLSRAGVEFVTLPVLFKTSSVVSVHLPLLFETKGLITKVEVLSMLPGSLLINTARKEIFDSKSVLDGLHTRQDIFLAVDDFQLLETGFFSLSSKRFLATPHVAGVTVESLRKMQDIVAQSVVDAFV